VAGATGERVVNPSIIYTDMRLPYGRMGGQFLAKNHHGIAEKRPKFDRLKGCG
jgi:hypothetical protein